MLNCLGDSIDIWEFYTQLHWHGKNPKIDRSLSSGDLSLSIYVCVCFLYSVHDVDLNVVKKNKFSIVYPFNSLYFPYFLFPLLIIIQINLVSAHSLIFSGMLCLVKITSIYLLVLKDYPQLQ